jgi:hypothetical protein
MLRERARSAASVQWLADLAVSAAWSTELEIRTVHDLSAFAACSKRTLQYRCKALGMTPHDLVRFVQCLRAVLTHDPDRHWNAGEVIPYSDVRTLRKLLAMAGLDEESNPGVTWFVEHQRFCVGPAFRRAILQTIRAGHVA